MQHVLISRSELFKPVFNPCAVPSNDGTCVAFVGSYEGLNELYAGPLQQPLSGKAVTRSLNTGVATSPWRVPVWVDGDRKLVFQRDIGSGPAAYRVFSLNLADGIETELLPLRQGRSAVSGSAISDDRLLSITANGRDLRFNDTYVINVVDGATVAYIENSSGWDGLWLDGELNPCVILKTDCDRGGFALHAYAHDEAFFEVGAEDDLCTRILGASSCGQFVYAASSVGRDTAALVEISVRTGSVSVLGEHSRVDVAGAVFHPGRRCPQAIIATDQKPEMIPLTTDFSAAQDRISSTLGSDFIVERSNRDFTKWAIATWSSDKPHEFYIGDPATGDVYPLSHGSESDAVQHRSPVRFLQIRARDGEAVPCYLTYPRSFSGDAPPLVVKLHGGPWTRDFGGWDPEAQWLANRGYAVLAVNFRGSAGFGKRFLVAGAREWGGKVLDDVDDAVGSVTASGYVNPSKVAVIGHSFGGYAALMATIRRPDLYCAANASSAPIDLVKLFDIPEWANFSGTLRTHLGDPSKPDELHLLNCFSPFYRIDELKRPIMLDLGEWEPMDLVEKSEAMIQRARRNGVQASLAVFQKEGHVLSSGAASEYRRYLLERFLAFHLGGHFEDWPDASISQLIKKSIGLESFDARA